MSLLDRFYCWKVLRLRRIYQVTEDVQKNGHKYRAIVRQLAIADITDMEQMKDVQRKAQMVQPWWLG